jgi:transposase
MKAALSTQLNKSDRNDARGIAHMMRVGLYRPVHVKTLASQKRRMLLTSRQLLQAKALDIENDLRGTLRNFGLKVGVVGTAKFEARIRELVADHPDLAAIAEPLLVARRVLREQLGVLHRRLLAVVNNRERIFPSEAVSSHEIRHRHAQTGRFKRRLLLTSTTWLSVRPRRFRKYVRLNQTPNFGRSMPNSLKLFGSTRFVSVLSPAILPESLPSRF